MGRMAQLLTFTARARNPLGIPRPGVMNISISTLKSYSEDRILGHPSGQPSGTEWESARASQLYHPLAVFNLFQFDPSRV